MSSQLPPSHLSDFISQWVMRFENHKKKIASEEKITEMKLGNKIAFYIQHAEESTLRSSDKRRLILYQYKIFLGLIDHLMKEKDSIEDMNHLLERAKVGLEGMPGKKTSLNKTKQLIHDFQIELNKWMLAQKKSEPSNEIKR